MKTLSLIILLFPYYVLLSLSPPDSCLKTYDRPEDETFTNPYDVRVDSCEGSATFGEFYSKGYFSITLKYNIIPRFGLFPEDTLIEYNISDIETIYPNAISEFQNLESQYGAFKFLEQQPHLPDTSNLDSRTLFINFEGFVNIESAVASIQGIEIVSHASFVSWFRVLSKIKEIQELTFLNYNNKSEILNIMNKTGLESKLVIYNIQGNEVLSQFVTSSEANINLTGLNRGVYFIYFNENFTKLIK